MDSKTGLPIKISGLSARYGDRGVLEVVNVVFPQRETTAIIGPSGSGKSTLLKCIAYKLGELGPAFHQQGTVSLGDTDIEDIGSVELRGAIVGTVMQKPTAFVGSIFENVAIGLRTSRLRLTEGEIKARVQEGLELVNLWEEVKDRLGESASSLSGGQLQRLCFARSLVLNPKIMLLDEPTSALDQISSAKIAELVENLKRKGITILWVSHDIKLVAAISDKIIVMDKGRIVDSSDDYANRTDMLINPKTTELSRLLSPHARPDATFQARTGSSPLSLLTAPGEIIRRSSVGLKLRETFIHRVPTTLAALSLPALFMGVGYTLVSGSWPALHKFGPAFFTTADWNTASDNYGALVPITGTLLSAGLAVAWAAPAARQIAFYLNEICHHRLRGLVTTGVDTLAAIPSVIYGLFGALYGVPLAQQAFSQLPDFIDDIPGLSTILAGPNFGKSALTASILLGCMILPHIAAASREALAAVPPEIGEAARNLGMTFSEVNKRVKIPYARQALSGAAILGLGRALGETMAVSFVLGSSEPSRLVFSLIAPNTSITDMLANKFQESDGLQLSSLVALGLTLFGISVAINSTRQLAQLPFFRSLSKSSEEFINPIARKLTHPLSNKLANQARLMKTILPRWWSAASDEVQLTYTKRERSNAIKTWLARGSTYGALAVPAGILGVLAYNGIGGLLSPDTYTMSTPAAAGLGEVVRGGLLNSICGSLEITGPAILVSAAVGLGAAMHMAEYGRKTKLTALNHFIVDNLLSTPSIIYGIFAYSALVNSTSPIALGHFSGLAGIAALAMLATPTIVRTAEDALLSVDEDFRRAGAALGAPRGYVQKHILRPIARKAIVTGTMLALARISGETAPLLWTALGNLNFNANLAQPMETLQNTIYRFASSAYDNQIQLAWTAALLVTSGVVGLNAIARRLTSSRDKPAANLLPLAARELTSLARHPVMAVKRWVPSSKARLRRANGKEPG